MTIQAVTRVELDGHDVLGIRAANPGPFTLTGTNSWIVSRDPAWLVDPGPALPDHIAALVAEIQRRGGLGGIALTHDHRDHSEAVAVVRSRFDRAPLAAGRGAVDLVLTDGVAIRAADGARDAGPRPRPLRVSVRRRGAHR